MLETAEARMARMALLSHWRLIHHVLPAAYVIA
jgi:hypothetical protein